MFTGMTKTSRIIGFPDSQLPDKWSSTVYQQKLPGMWWAYIGSPDMLEYEAMKSRMILQGAALLQLGSEGGGGLGVETPPPPKFRRPSKIVPNSTLSWKLLKIVEFRTPTPQDVW